MPPKILKNSYFSVKHSTQCSMCVHLGFVSHENSHDVYGNFLIGSSRTELSAHGCFGAFCPWHDTDAFGRCTQQRVKARASARNLFVHSLSICSRLFGGTPLFLSDLHTAKGLSAHLTTATAVLVILHCVLHVLMSTLLMFWKFEYFMVSVRHPHNSAVLRNGVCH